MSLREYDVTYLLLRTKSVVLVRHQVETTYDKQEVWPLSDSDLVTLPDMQVIIRKNVVTTILSRPT